MHMQRSRTLEDDQCVACERRASDEGSRLLHLVYGSADTPSGVTRAPRCAERNVTRAASRVHL